MHEDEAQGRPYDHRMMRRLLAYLSPYRGQVAFAAVLVFADALVGLAGPWLTKEAIDHGIRHRDFDYLRYVTLLYLAVLGMGLGLGYLHHQVMQRVGQHVMLDLRMGLFRHLQRLPISYYDRQPVGRVMTRVTNDVDVLNELFTAGVVALFGDVFALIGIVVAMVHLNAELLAVAFSVLPLIVIVTLLFRSRVRRSFREIRVRLAHVNAFLNESLTGMSTVQILNREDHRFTTFSEINASHREANLRAVFYHALFFPVLELVGALAVSLIVWYGGRQVMATGITLGTLVAFIQYTQRFFRPISDLSEKYNLLQQAMASSERIFDILDTPADPAAIALEDLDLATPPSADITRAPRLEGRVTFEHVWFSYRDDRWVLEDVSFEIAPGERVALVGATGAGKSTIANLLLRFYAPQRGMIRLDGRPLEDWPAQALRPQIGVVLQDVFLFSGSIEQNLGLGAGLSHERIERAAREVHAHEFVSTLPGGYASELTERGATLSSGQRQLLSFARALAHDPAFLILDEATSSVDAQTEALIQDALDRLMAGRTSLVIAHRLSTIQRADRVIALHHGRVREVGTHAELLRLGGIYARLYELQAIGGRGNRPKASPWSGSVTPPDEQNN